jgi:hypothetical protein
LKEVRQHVDFGEADVTGWLDVNVFGVKEPIVA